MAKTTSQIVKENREKEKIVDQLASAMKARDERDAQAKAAKSTSLDNYSSATETNAVTRVQRAKEEAAQPKAASIPSQSEIRADAAKKNLERYLKSDKRKEFQKKQQQNLHAQAMLTGITDGQWTPEVDETEKKIQNEIDYWETEAKKERDAERISQQMAEIDSMDEQEKAAFDKYASKGTYTTAEEIDAYQNLKNKYGDRLDELVEARERTENQARAEQAAAYGAEKASTNGGAFLHSLLSVPANVVGGLTGTAARINDVFNGTGQYETLAQNTLGDVPMAYANAVRSTTQQRIEGEDPTLGRKALGTIYQGGMSALDTAARTLTGSPLAAATLAGTGSFASTMQSAAAQGASQEQALALATINSGIEAATEKLPLDELFKVAKGGAKPAAQVVKNVLKQMGIEILEEEASLIGTTLAEAAILQEKSGYNQQIMKAAAQGVPYEQAKAEADRALLAEAINTALVSGVAGLFGAAGAEYAGARYVGDTNQQQTAEGTQTAQAEEQTQTQENAEQPVQEAQEQPQTIQETEKTPQQKAMDSMVETITQKPQETAEREAKPNALWGKRDGDNGWGGLTENSVWATALAMKEVNPEYFQNYMTAGTSGNISPIINAVVNAAEDVRQESISPMAAATVINEVYTQNGEDGLKALYNPRNGNLYDSVLDRMKVVDMENGQRYDNVKNTEGVVTYGEEINNGGNGQNYEGGPGNVSSEIAGNSKRAAQSGNQRRIYERNGGQAVHVADSEGRSIEPDISEKIKGTAITDKDGKPLAVYHFTDNMDFDVFAKGDTGFHFGSIDQADNRAAEKKTPDGRVFRVYLNIKNPVRADKDIMGWHPGGTALKLWGMGILSDDEMSRVTSTYKMGDGYDSESATILRDILEQKGYDGIVYPNAYEGAGDSYMAFHDDQIIRTQIKPYGKSTQQVDTQEQSAEGGQVEQAQKQTTPQTGDVKMQRARPDDVRPITVPVTDPQGKRVSEAAGNAQGSELTPDNMAKEIEQLVADGNLGFDVRTNRESLENAAAEIKKKGPANVRNRITRSIESRKIKDGDIEQAILLYQKYANGDKDTDLDNASEMMVDLATMANITGRNLQLFKLLRKMTPEGQLLAVQKEVERNVQSLVSSGKVKKGYEAQIDESLKTEYLNAAKELQKAQKGEDAAKIAEAEQKVKDAQNAIYASEAAKMPATFKAKWDAWRYMAMLGNAKTQVRNVAGNLMFEPYKVVKDKMAALVEKSLPQDQRTKSLMQDPALLNWAREDAKTEDVTNALKYSAKLGDNTAKDQISEQMKVFDNKALEAARKFVAKVPQAGDMLFKNDYYSRSLAGFLKARGYTAAQVKSGQVSNDILNEARTYAISEAMKATFNDSNAFSDAITSVRFKDPNTAWKKAFNVAGEGLLPFRRTPANIIVRFTEYSPAGIAKGMWDMATHVRNGDMSAATAIDQITAGLTGTGVMMLGYMMAAGMNGIKLTGSGADEDEKRQGHQDYALEFAADGQEYSYKIDWAAPANLPLFVGANIYNAIKDSGADPDVSKLTAVIRGMSTAFEPMLSLSCLSSLNDLFESGKYSDDNEALYTAAATIATSYFTQGIPALLRQGYQATQETKQTTFANDADPTIRDLQKTAANIPFAGDKFQTEKVNAWGETEDQGDWMARTFNAFVNPGSLKKIDNSALEQEITRLNNAQTENVTPPTAGKTLSYTDKDGNAHKDVRLTEEQYQTLARTQGQTAKRILDEMIASKDYKALNDEQKALAIQQAYSYARKTAEIAAIEDHTGYDDAWMIDMQGRNEATYIMRRIANNSLNSAFTALDTAWDKGYNEKGRSDRLEWAYEAFKAMTPQAKKEVKEWATGTTAKYIEARENGITHDQFLSAAENVAKVTGTGSNGTVRDIDRRQAIAKTSGLTEQQKDKIMKVYMEDYDPADDSPATTELKYDYIRNGLGLTAEQYAETYRARLDNDKKADQIAAMMALGYDKKTATTLYNVYASNAKGKAAFMDYYNSK